MRKIKENIYFQLFISFFNIGLFTIGGGMAMIPLIQKAVVEDKKWMTDEEMVDCIAVAQSLPGVVAVNTATYIGHYKKGFLGAIVASVGVILPSLIVMILVACLLRETGDNKYVNGALVGIKATAVGLIIFATWKIGRQILKDWFSWTVATLSFVAILILGLSAIWAIVGGIILGISYNYFMEKKNGGEVE